MQNPSIVHNTTTTTLVNVSLVCPLDKWNNSDIFLTRFFCCCCFFCVSLLWVIVFETLAGWCSPFVQERAASSVQCMHVYFGDNVVLRVLFDLLGLTCIQTPPAIAFLSTWAKTISQEPLNIVVQPPIQPQPNWVRTNTWWCTRSIDER